MKKAMSILLSLTLLLTLAACGAAEAEPTVEATTETTTEATTEVTTEATTEETTEATEPPVSEAQRLYDLGMEALENGDAVGAREHFEAARAHDETDPLGWLGLAEIFIRDYDFEGAEALLTEALEKTGNAPAIAEKLEMIQGEAISDSSGRVLVMKGYDAVLMKRWYIIHEYLPNGKPGSVTSYDEEGNVTGHVQLEYDAQGRETVGVVMNSGTGQVRRKEKDYDEAGNVVEERIYTSEGVLQSRLVNQFNELDQMIRQEVYKGTVLDSINHYTYNSLGLRERVDYCDANDVLKRYCIISYNEEEKWIGDCLYDAEGNLISREVITYDDNGKEVKQETFDADGNLITSFEYE